MTVEEKREKIDSYCNCTNCDNCILVGKQWDHKHVNDCLRIAFASESELDRALILISEGDIAEEDAPEYPKENAPAEDPVNRPSHYTDGKIEVIDYIEDKKLGFCLGNAIKYISRAGKKNPDKEIEDLLKAKWYIERRIKELEEARE